MPAVPVTSLVRQKRHAEEEPEGFLMTYSYSQISQYLTCPRRYRHRYLDGWQEKEQRAAMLFGRAFEQALAALFRHEDPGAVLFEQWKAYKSAELAYAAHDTWDSMLQQGVQLLQRFVQDGRVRISRPKTQQQVQFSPNPGLRAPASCPMSMPSASWTEHPASWSGRPLLPDTRKNLRASLVWIRS